MGERRIKLDKGLLWYLTFVEGLKYLLVLGYLQNNEIDMLAWLLIGSKIKATASHTHMQSRCVYLSLRPKNPKFPFIVFFLLSGKQINSLLASSFDSLKLCDRLVFYIIILRYILIVIDNYDVLDWIIFDLNFQCWFIFSTPFGQTRRKCWFSGAWDLLAAIFLLRGHGTSSYLSF